MTAAVVKFTTRLFACIFISSNISINKEGYGVYHKLRLHHLWDFYPLPNLFSLSFWQVYIVENWLAHFTVAFVNVVCEYPLQLPRHKNALLLIILAQIFESRSALHAFGHVKIKKKGEVHFSLMKKSLSQKVWKI